MIECKVCHLCAFAQVWYCLSVENSTLSVKPVKKMVLYFTRTGTMVSFLRALNLFQPGLEFYSDNIEQLSENRLWRLSKIDPLNSNLAFVLYQYTGPDLHKPKYIIKVFHNEKQVRVTGCNSYQCDLDKFLSRSRQFINSCKNSKSSCTIEQTKTTDLTKKTLFYLVLIMLVVVVVAGICFKQRKRNAQQKYNEFI